MKKAFASLLLTLSLLFLGAANVKANDVYLSQSATGSANGTSCTNARAVSYFNSASNWGSGAAQIGPGTHVFLCGSVSTALQAQGNGTAGNPIIIDGGTKTNDWEFNSRSYFTFQNIHSTAGEYFLGGSPIPHDITFRNNILERCTSNPADLIRSEGAYNILIEGNKFKNCATSNESHDDMIQTWNGKGAPHDWTIRFNYFEMNTTATSNKSCHMIEGFTGRLDIYGNVYVGIDGADAANCVDVGSNASGLQLRWYNNTLVQKPGGFQPMLNLDAPGSFDLKNNIVYSSGASNVRIGDATLQRQNNLWFGPGIPSCSGTNDTCGVDPQFTNFNGNDFSLTSASPAVGTGVALPSDFAFGIAPGSTWPNPTIVPRTTWDKGAYVFNGAAPPPPPPPAVSVFVSPTSANLQVGTQRQFTASVLNATDTSVTWAVTGGSISASGLYDATTAGTFSVTATSNADPTKSASASVTVTAVAPPPPPPTDQTITFTKAVTFTVVLPPVTLTPAPVTVTPNPVSVTPAPIVISATNGTVIATPNPTTVQPPSLTVQPPSQTIQPATQTVTKNVSCVATIHSDGSPATVVCSAL